MAPQISILASGVQPSGRRRFLEQLTGLGLGAYAGISAACRTHRAPPGETSDAAPDASGPTLVTFTAATYATLSAICERILPRDSDPGAIDLGVPAYVDRALATPELASAREVVLRVLPLVDRETRARHGGKAFHEATAEEQDDVLRLWERGHDGGQRFFPIMLSLSLEGAFGDPKYGGNAGGRGFQMVGYTPGPPLHETSMDAHVHVPR